MPTTKEAMECTPDDVWPVPDGRPKNLVPGPWMPGALKPVREGRYLRHWQGSDDKAYSFFRKGVWFCSEFWDSKSDAQDIPWRGALAARASRPGQEG